MSPRRLLVAGLLTVLLVGLAAWQGRRQQRIVACEASGGVWNGAVSRCDAPRPSPILEREGLRRG